MERKLLANLGVTTSSFWVAAIPVAVGFLVFLSRYSTRPLDRMREQIPTLQAGITASIVAAVLGSAVNDSGAIVGGVTLLVMTASLAWLALDATTPAPPPGGGEPGGDENASAANGAGPGAAAEGSERVPASAGDAPVAAVPPARAGVDPA
jgi:hypothetical protein